MGIALAVDERFGTVALPPAKAVSDTQIRTAIEAFQKAKLAAVKARQDAVDLEQTTRPEAMGKDAEALAAALEAGKPDPGRVHAEKADRAIADAHRHAEARQLLQDKALAFLREVLDERADLWRGDIEEELGSACADWQSHLDALMQTYVRISAARALLRFHEVGRYWPHWQELEPFVGMAKAYMPEAVAVLRGFARPAESTRTTEADAAA